MNTQSIQEYRMNYPGTAEVPTVSQGFGLAAVLERVEAKRVKRLRREEWLQVRVAAIRDLAASIAGTLFHRRTLETPLHAVPEERVVAKVRPIHQAAA